MIIDDIATNDLFVKINSRPLSEKLAKTAKLYDFQTGIYRCPECRQLTDTSEDDNKNAAYCSHCHKDFNNFDFAAKAVHNYKPDGDYTQKEYGAIVAYAAPIISTADKPKQANNTASNAPKKPNNKPAAVEGTITPKIDRASIFGQDMAAYLGNSFNSYVDDNKKFEGRKTGFTNIDLLLKSFQPGIYIVGGLAALGKTTFTLQLLNQIAQYQGETCIFVSYEMQAGYLYSKLLAQEVFKAETRADDGEPVRDIDVKTTLTASQVSFGRVSKHQIIYDKIVKKFQTTPPPIYIWEYREVNVDKLLDRLSAVCEYSEKPPVVVIDYLQLLATDGDNPKTAIDSALRKLFNFRRDTNTTFVIISSLNRANYNTEISFESFKESGSIEYSADCIFGLQLMLDSRTAAEVEKAKNSTPRRVQLKCLKNRFGANFDCGFNYYPQADIFIPMTFDDYTKPNFTTNAAADDIL